ncbi:hypothetical protein RhiirA4_510082 [Rhizophagus irregularis]|uniref:SWIM-type domain-containing protein n=1 Tax=Rhizophagus irregularis TaxID=588596 RepID=A0A2I1HF49_9GLOM|nr:hypothetical protein RhiirA4_510082 [Rhizophagus irregularis]
MNKENLEKEISSPNDKKICTRCLCTKKKEDFFRSRGNNPQYEYSTCNKCYKGRKNVQKEIDPISRKKTKLEATLSAPVLTISSQKNINSNHINLELNDSSQHENHNIIEDDQYNNNVDDTDGLLYGLDEVQELISKQFQDAEDLNEPVKLAFEIELDSRLIGLIECNFQEFQDLCDLKTIKKNFQQLVNVLLLPLEYGSGYYWEVREIHLITKKKKFTGCVTAYLGCTQQEDREWKRPENLPPKRRSEARAPINRYACMGNVILTIDPQHQRVLIQGSHLQAHEHPQYRRVIFPAAAKQWIQNNVEYHLHNSELYRRLQHHNLIDAQIHTKEQVYYWATVFSKQTYIFNLKNQLLSTKEYLEKQQYFKIIYYLENDFVKALGFTTPLLNNIGITNLKEIVVDSTFKTNQERFELFAVNANCGGYGMPVAYLYLLTCDGEAEAYNDPKNQINTRVQVLCKFFTNLRNEGLLPAFVLLDKDAGEISAIEEAWSWTTNLQLCYWHLEHAISRRLKDKKSKSSGYSKNKAMEAYQQFDFINSSWIPNNGTGSLCPDDKIKEIINMIKRHANMHPLIPVVGYLWINWYNKKDWKLFARSAYSSAISMARTTMITESHWRVLKYNYKYNYNRPRLDRLTQILVEQLVPDCDLKLTQYCTNRTFPAWWQTFKKDWNKAMNTNIESGMDERYHIDATNWICSCPAYSHNPYFLCKHLVAKKNILPTFMETARRHDYPLVFFGTDKIPSICQENDPWKRTVIEDDFTNQSRSSSSNLRNVALIESNSTADEMEVKLAHYKKVFDFALMLYKREKDNVHFVKSFDTLMKPAVKAVEECKKKLDAQTQQSTWKASKNGKLSFWLR